jgi:hypothetical protein
MFNFVKFLITLSCLWVAAPTTAQQPQRPQTMTFSYVDHPAMVNLIIPLIRDTYLKLGIKTEFVAQPSNRNLLLVDKNLVDGDVGYMRIVLAGYQNMITVEPALVSGIFTLLCKPQLKCTPAVLADAQQTIVSTSVSKNGMDVGFRGEIHSQFYIVNDLTLIPKFIRNGRFDYAIYPTTEQELAQMDLTGLQYVKLFQSDLYHVLHKKYAFMAPEISAALAATLAQKKTK